ncbi:hypothetical protein KKB83_05675 [Patescibacteria group bacterium]|nr:hypothetical protein [Patescibacteria group bacterium]
MKGFCFSPFFERRLSQTALLLVAAFCICMLANSQKQRAINVNAEGLVMQATANPGYVQMDPSGKGFIYDNGEKFIPVGHNAHAVYKREWQDDPVTGREYISRLGARIERDGCTDWCGDGCLPETEGLTYDEWFSQLEESGVNSLRLHFSSNVWRPGVHPLPVGKYNVMDEQVCAMLDGARSNADGFQDKQIDGEDLMINYPSCRWPDFSNENCGPLYGPKLRKSLITRMLASAESHSVKLKIVFFGTDGWSGDPYEDNGNFNWNSWEINPFNSANCRHDDPGKCGPISNRFDFWTNGTWNSPLFSEESAINYAKRYVAFIMHVWGDSTAIWDWELWNEINYASISYDHEQEMVNWVNNMAAYVKSNDLHHRPVSISSYNLSTSTDNQQKMQVFASPNIDYVQWHYYPRNEDARVQYALQATRDMEDIYNKPAFVGEFWPWTAQMSPIEQDVTGIFIEDSQKDDPPHEEYPYRPSLARLWLQLISSGTSVSHRWHEPGLTGIRYWEVHRLYQGVAKFINVVSWDNWNLANSIPWEDFITGDIDFVAGRGDGDQIFAMIHGTGDSVNVEINNLDDGAYVVRAFDFISGEVAEIYNGQQTFGGTLNLSLSLSNSTLDVGNDGYDRKRVGILLVEKEGVSIPTPTPSPSIEGDLNNDGVVDIFDLVIIGSCFGQEAIGDCARADANGNGVVDIFDLVTVGSNFGSS